LCEEEEFIHNGFTIANKFEFINIFSLFVFLVSYGGCF